MTFPLIRARDQKLVLILLVLIGTLAQPQSVYAGIGAYSASNTATGITYSLTYTGTYAFRRVYIDTDQKIGTGFNTGQVGAEYLLENANLYRRPNIPAGNDWKWTLIKTVTYSNANGVARWTLLRSDVGETSSPNGSDLIFQLESPLTSSPKVTHNFSAMPTATSTATKTPVPTATKTATATSTATAKPTATSTATVTPSATPLPTKTATSSPLPTATATATTAPSPTATATKTATPLPPSPTLTSIPALTTVNYSIDATGAFPNPERGFYHHLETFNAAYTPLDLNVLRSYQTNEQVSLILRLWYLDGFQNTPISADYLNKIRVDFDVLRSAGLKAIVRFAYTNKTNKPYADADKSVILGHIGQLAPILAANADVIATLQAGFIGVWGEWYYTNFFGSDGAINANQWADRKAVHEALLNALPTTRTVQLRTPLFKTTFYAANALTAAEAFNGSFKARTGHHNDCFLADETDYGTYVNVTADKAYLAAENQFVPQGGETCNPSTYSTWPNADSEMRTLHYSFLNKDYHPTVLGSWGSNIATVARNLGYRFNLVNASYATQAKPGSEFDVSMSLANTGYAAPFNPHAIFLVLRNQSSGQSFRVNLSEDVRRWAPATSNTVTRKICVPATMPTGNYDFYLHIADPALPTRVDYAIRLANLNTWDAATGFNKLLHTIVINANAANAVCSPTALVLAAS